MAEKTMIIESLYDIGAIQFGEFTLKSGQTSSIYLNLRKIISFPELLRTIAESMWKTINECSFEVVCGVPYTALPIATCLSLDHNIPMVMRRKEKKDYGTKQSIEGVFNQGDRVLIIEDIITTGSSIIETANDLETAGLVVKDVIALIDREQGGHENLSQRFKTHSILTMTDVLTTLVDSIALKTNERDIVAKLIARRIS